MLPWVLVRSLKDNFWYKNINNFSSVQKVIINDINPDLIMAYNVIKNNVKELIVKLKKNPVQHDSHWNSSCPL